MDKNSEELKFWTDVWDRQIRDKGYWDHSLRSAPIADYAQARAREGREHVRRILSMTNLPADFLAGRVVVDIGAGPVCALEFSNAKAGYVIDPCSDLYRSAGLLVDGPLPVQYFNCGAERVPLPRDSVDVAVAFNSLDHVDDLEVALVEIVRILKPGGLLLVNLELDHAPTACEPHSISKEQFDAMRSRLRLVAEYEHVFVPSESVEGAAYMHHHSSWLHGRYGAAKFP